MIPSALSELLIVRAALFSKNEELAEIKPFIKVNLTPILVFSELTDAYRKPNGDPALLSFFNNWVHAWENKDIAYIDAYHSEFLVRKKQSPVERI